MTHPGNVAVEEPRDAGRPVPAGASIRVTQGFYEGLEVPLDRDWMVIGRGRGADVVIAESTISRAHVAIVSGPQRPAVASGVDSLAGIPKPLLRGGGAEWGGPASIPGIDGPIW